MVGGTLVIVNMMDFETIYLLPLMPSASTVISSVSSPSPHDLSQSVFGNAL